MNIIDEVAERIYEDAHAGMSNVWGWNDEGLDHEHPDTRQRFMGYARSALAVLPTNSDDHKFTIGDRVRKTKGSSWQGRVVGFYSTDLTPIGYCVESEREPGSVQIYPEAALEAIDNGN